MDGLLERIGAARAKLQQVRSEQARCRAALATLESNLRDKEREAEVLRARIRDMEQENADLQAAHQAQLAERRSGTREKIDELVNEIDQCLALLNA